MITAMDVAITETLDSLKRLGFMEDTIVVFASDVRIATPFFVKI